MTLGPALVLAAHGSSHPGYAPVVESIAVQVRRARPGLDVVVGYLDHGPPTLREIATDRPGVVVPLLLSNGYHVAVDIPAQAPCCVVAAAVGPDDRLADVMEERLRTAGWSTGPAVLAAAGSTDAQAIADVYVAAGMLARRLGVAVDAAFVSAGEPRLADLAPDAVASYLLAPGRFADLVVACGASVVSEPIGDAAAVAEIVLDRYDAVNQAG